MNKVNKWFKPALLILALAIPGSAMANGVVRGTVKTDAGPAAGVVVSFRDGGSQVASTVTGGDGSYRTTISAGTYEVVFTAMGLQTYTQENVNVSDGATFTLDVTMIAPVNIQEVLTVQSASRRPERIVEAPAAVTVVTEKEIETQAASGQLPRVLQNTPGVELAQSGVYDFNLSVRGFNSSLNRRILVLIDGRDPAVGFLGNQEWGALSFALDDLSSLELVRGPGSALYGANAFAGVLNMTTKRPLDTLGGKVRVSGGELSSRRVDFRYAGKLGDRWAYRVNAGGFGSDTWSESRTAADLGPDGQFEYAGLTPEQLPLDEDDVEGVYGSVRVDGEFGANVLSLEVGTTTVERGMAVTGIGRVQIDESERPYFRANFNTPHVNLLYFNTMRDTPIGQTALGSGGKLFEDSSIQNFEVQVNYNFFDDRLKLVGGAAYREIDIDTANDAGFQTLMREEKNEDQQSVFGQATFSVNEHIDLLVAGRIDDSSLHEQQESPKGAIVYKINPNNTLRLTYNEAFQTPNFSEFFLRAPSANIIPFGLLQDAVVQGGFGLDLRNTLGSDGQPILDWQNFPVIAAGNPELVPEQVESWEIGYKGIIGSKLFLTVDYYQSNIQNFVTDLLPGVNPAFPAFQFSDEVPAAVQQALLDNINGALGPVAIGLSSVNADTDPFFGTVVPAGHPVIVVSYTNAGEVDTEGIDLAFNYYLNERWAIDGNWSWFDFDVVDQLVGDQLLPNTAENKYNLGVSYSSNTLSGSLKFKHVDEFEWAAGVFQGPIPAYDIVNLAVDYRFMDNWQVTFTGNNILNEEHYQLFGGSVLERRMLVSVAVEF